MLILTEKKNVAEIYRNALDLKDLKNGSYQSSDRKITVTWAAGHLYNLFYPEDYDSKFLKSWNEKDYPFIPKNYRYKPDRTKSKTRNNCESHIRNALKNGEEIVIATDPDREGEVIARLILNALKVPLEKTSRIWNCEGLDRKQILKGIEERKKDSLYDNLALQGIMQKQSDWVMGINLSRCYSILNSETFSVGRVQTAVLKVIYERQMRIKLFLPSDYYEVRITEKNGNVFFFQNKITKKISFKTYEEAEKIKKSIEGKNFTVSKVERNEKSEKPPRLYDLAALQMDAFNIYKIGVSETLETAQKLYNEIGVLSYPRTDSVALGEEDEVHVRKLIEEINNKRKPFENFRIERITRENKRIFNSAETSGHHAIIPSGFYEERESLEWKIWDLVYRRLMMQGMGDYVINNIKAWAVNDEYVIVGEGKQTKEKGWKEADLYEVEKDNELNVKEGEEIEAVKVEILKKKTQPPKYFNEASIIKFMRNPLESDDEGIKLSSIGTEATQAAIIQRLYDVKYIEKVKGHIEITEKGIKLIEQIAENPDLDTNTDVRTTTMWEKLNKENPEKLLEEIEKITVKCVENIREKMKTVSERKSICKCPSCGKDIVRGKTSWYCTGYKQGCEFNIGFKVMGNDVDEQFIKSFIENGETKVLRGIKKDGEECAFKFRLNDEKKVIIEFDGEKESIAVCPKCGGDVFSFKKVYKCSDQNCNFFMWKESCGIEYTKDDVKNICENREIMKDKKKKDGNMVRVRVWLGEDKEELKMEYIN